MYIHLGAGTVVRQRDVIGVFDMDTATVARQTKLFLRDAERRGEMQLCSTDLPRSFVLCSDKVIISDLNTPTVKSRAIRAPGKASPERGGGPRVGFPAARIRSSGGSESGGGVDGGTPEE